MAAAAASALTEQGGDMQRVVAGARQHRLLSLLQPWAAHNASMREFGTSGLKVERERAMLHDSPE